MEKQPAETPYQPQAAYNQQHYQQPQQQQPYQQQYPQQGAPQYQQQPGGYQQQYQQPQGGYHQPQGGYQQPQGGYQQPVYQGGIQDVKQGDYVVGSTAPLMGGPQTGTPIYSDGAPILRQKFLTQGYKDVWAAVAFVLTLVAAAVIAIYNAKTNDISLNFSGGTHEDHKVEQYLAAAAGVSFGACLLAMIVMRLAPVPYIWGANILCILIDLGVAIYCFTSGDGPGAYTGAVFIFLGLIHAIWLYFTRRRIPFAGVLLSHSVRTVTNNWGTILTSFFSLAFLLVYFITWLIMILPLMWAYQDGTNTGATYAAFCGALLVWFWSTQVFTNIVHVTASGTVATWYFAGDQMPSAPSLAAFKRATTTSFGSICFGSLLVAILKLIHAMLRSAQRRGGFMACIALCFISIIEWLLQYFNVYAFTHVAIYGYSYIDAAKATWEMIKNCGWAAVFNDNLVFPVLNLTTFVNSLAIGVFLGLVGNSVIIGILCFFVAVVIHIVMLRVVYSGIVTIFVCYAECSDVLQMTNPQFNAEIQAAHAELQQSAC